MPTGFRPVLGRVLLTLFAFLFSVRGEAHAVPLELGTSGIFGPKYSEILKETERWRATFPDLVELVDYGKSLEGRTLRLVMVRKAGNFRKRSALLMSGSTHGNEYLNIEDRLPGEILARAAKPGPVARFLEEGGVYLFVPVLNPDGYDKHTRENARGVDLNRDWTVSPVDYQGFTEVETKRLVEAIHQLTERHHLKLQITVDYHCCSGALLHPWSFPAAPKLKITDQDRHRAVGELVTKYLKVDYGTTGQILGYSPVGTTKDFYFDRYGAAAFTFEGRYQKEKDYLADHVTWWEKMTALVRGEEELPGLALTTARKKLFFLAD